MIKLIDYGTDLELTKKIACANYPGGDNGYWWNIIINPENVIFLQRNTWESGAKYFSAESNMKMWIDGFMDGMSEDKLKIWEKENLCNTD